MARTVQDTKLGNRTQRSKLPARGKPYWAAIDEGLHLGYRKGAHARRWVVRRYVGDGRYLVETLDGAVDDFEDADGVHVLSWSQAQAKAREMRVETWAEHDELSGPYTVGNALDAYLTRLQAEGKAAANASKIIAEAHIRPELGDVEVARLRADHLRQFLADLADRPARLRTGRAAPQKFRAAPSSDEAKRARRATANRTWNVLRAALNNAFHDGKAPSDRAWRQVKSFKSADSARARFLTVAEARRLMNAAEGAFRDLVAAALASGARYGELLRLNVGDYNPDVGTITIRQSKSGHARHVHLTDEGRALFDGLTAGRAPSGPMLARKEGARWGGHDQVRPMRAAVKAARLDPIGFHGLRHTYASLAIMAGAPLNVVAHNLGHADTRMVEKHYGHLAPSYLAETTRRTAPTFGVKPDESVARPIKRGRNRAA